MIRNIILEIYDLSPEDMAKRPKEINKWSDQELRVLGRQTPEEQREDISILQKYQKKLNSTPEGKKLIKAYLTGKGVSTFHSINYTSFASDTDQKRWDRPDFGFSGWIKMYG